MLVMLSVITLFKFLPSSVISNLIIWDWVSYFPQPSTQQLSIHWWFWKITLVVAKWWFYNFYHSSTFTGKMTLSLSLTSAFISLLMWTHKCIFKNSVFITIIIIFIASIAPNLTKNPFKPAPVSFCYACIIVCMLDFWYKKFWPCLIISLPQTWNSLFLQGTLVLFRGE